MMSPKTTPTSLQFERKGDANRMERDNSIEATNLTADFSFFFWRRRRHYGRLVGSWADSIRPPPAATE